MTLAELIAELERRAMVHREKAHQFAERGGASGFLGAAIMASMTHDAAAEAFEQALELVRMVQQ